VTDPDDNEWEIYTVLADAEQRDPSDKCTIVTIGSTGASQPSETEDAKASVGFAPTDCAMPRVVSVRHTVA
jgi:hypothetical protein